MTDKRPTVLIDGLRQPECLRWHEGALWFSDMHARRVYRSDAEGHAKVIAEFDDIPGGLGFLPDGRMLVTMRRTRRLLELDGDGKRRLYVDLNVVPGDDLNDIVIDGRGGIYLDNTFRLVGEHEELNGHLRDTLLYVSPDRKVHVVADDIYRPNGLAVTPDGATLVVASSPHRTLTAFTIGSDGLLSNRRIFADVGTAAPDGLCADAEGALWAASGPTAEAVRVFAGGTVVDRVSCSPKRCTSLALGGPDRKTLFMSTWVISPNLPRNPKIEDHVETKGWIEAIRVNSAGAGWP